MTQTIYLLRSRTASSVPTLATGEVAINEEDGVLFWLDSTDTVIGTDLLEGVTIRQSAYGGTGNGFTKFTGPTTTEKEYALPDEDGLVLVSASDDGVVDLTALNVTFSLPPGETNAFVFSKQGTDPYLWFDTNDQTVVAGKRIVAVDLETSATTPFRLLNGFLVSVDLTAQSGGTTTLTIPDFANVSDTFAFATLAQTLSNKAFVSPTSDEYRVAGTKVVGAQGAVVADATGGVVVDDEARAAINALLAELRTHGLIAT